MVMDEPSSVTKEYYVHFPWRCFARRRTCTDFPVSFKRPVGAPCGRWTDGIFIIRATASDFCARRWAS
jgi:hypothetical protein